MQCPQEMEAVHRGKDLAQGADWETAHPVKFSHLQPFTLAAEQHP